MNAKVLIGIGFAMSVVAIFAWYLWSQHGPAALTGAEHVSVKHRLELVESNSSVPAPEPQAASTLGLEQQQPPPASTPATQQKTGVDLTSALVRAYGAMLAETTGGVEWSRRAARLPRMDRVIQSWVMGEYHRIEGVTNKGAHLFLLSSKGDFEAARFIWSLLTEGFRGQELTTADELILLVLPGELGQSARFHPEILEWLERGANISYWEQNRQWVSRNAASANRALQVLCIKGLGYSGRPEGFEALRRLRAVAEAAGDAGTLAEISDAAAVNAMVQRYGDAWFTGDVWQSAGQYLRLLDIWKDTEGREWREAFRRAAARPER